MQTKIHALARTARNARNANKARNARKMHALLAMHALREMTKSIAGRDKLCPEGWGVIENLIDFAHAYRQ